MTIISGKSAGPSSKGYKDPKVLGEAYAELGSMQEVADHFGVSKKLIHVHMKRFGLGRVRAGAKIDVEHAGALLDGGKTLDEVATLFGVCSATVTRTLRQRGIETDRFHRGHIVTWAGYIKVRTVGHPRADSKGYVHQHVLVMEAAIGRHLAGDEVVHHENGVKADNRIENLRLMDCREHRSLHSRQPRPKRRKI